MWPFDARLQTFTPRTSITTAFLNALQDAVVDLHLLGKHAEWKHWMPAGAGHPLSDGTADPPRLERGAADYSRAQWCWMDPFVDMGVCYAPPVRPNDRVVRVRAYGEVPLVPPLAHAVYFKLFLEDELLAEHTIAAGGLWPPGGVELVPATPRTIYEYDTGVQRLQLVIITHDTGVRSRGVVFTLDHP
jgi:hypothetical protein